MLGKRISSPTTRFYSRTLQSCLRVQLKYLSRGKFGKALQGFKIYFYMAANFLASVKLFPKRRYCEFCGWLGFAFLPIYYVDGYRADVFCPCCRLMDRYRTLIHFVRTSEWGDHIRK